MAYLSQRRYAAIPVYNWNCCNEITEKLEKAQQTTEDMFMGAENDGEDLLDESSK